MPAWKWTLQQLNNVFNALNGRICIASGTTQPHKEAHVAGNAIPDSAKAREMDEKPLLKQRWQWAIEVCSLGKSPHFLGDLWSLGREAEKIRDYTKPLCNTPLQF
jgi:hypothetical protein